MKIVPHRPKCAEMDEGYVVVRIAQNVKRVARVIIFLVKNVTLRRKIILAQLVVLVTNSRHGPWEIYSKLNVVWSGISQRSVVANPPY